ENETAARTRTHARGVAATVHPQGMAEQHRRARSERADSVKPDGDGMAGLTAILPELLAYAVQEPTHATAGNVNGARPRGRRRPRRSALAKIKAEREAALAEQAPSDPEPPADPDQTLCDSFEPRAPWENTADDPTEGSDAEAVPDAEADHEDRSEAEYSSGLIDEADVVDDATDDTLFHDSTPMHDGYGALE